ncbi:MAG: GLUG motif-containing protein, partial [Anaerohalosphaeraceae bacterium]
YIGGLVGYNHGVTTFSYASGSVNGTSNYVGGLIGYMEYGGSIASCYSTCTVIGANYVGGLVGYFHVYEGTITSCYATGTVNGTGSNVGGLAGYIKAGAIASCYATGDVSGTKDCIGGLAGYLNGGLSSSYATGMVNGAGSVGGLVGYQNSGTTTLCYATGTVIGTGSNVGGLVGYFTGRLTSCYATGTVHGTGNNIGGLIGTNSSGTVSSCFWDIETSGLTASAGGNGAQGKTTVEMQTLSTFMDAGWDFAGEAANGTLDHWRMCADGADYPRLSWEYGSGGDFACPDGVGVEDLEAIATRWLMTEGQAGYSYACDANGDGKIDMADFEVLAEGWMGN